MQFLELSEAIDVLANSALKTYNDIRGVKDRGDFVRKELENGRAAFQDLAIIAAFQVLGIEFDVKDKVNAYTVTQAINKTLLSGTDLQLTNVFDVDVSKGQIERYALEKINEGLGGELRFSSLKKPVLKREIKRYANYLVQKELAEGGGAIAEALGDSDDILKMIERYETERDKPPSDLPEAEGNRERQATYRATHSRHWEGK